MLNLPGSHGVRRRTALMGCIAGTFGPLAADLIAVPSDAPTAVSASLAVDAADRRFGTARDQDQINAAIRFVGSRGGGSVRIGRSDGPWTIRRSSSDDQKSGGILIEYSNVTLISDGAVLNLVDNCDFIVARSPLSESIPITAIPDATSITVSESALTTSVVGAWALVSVGSAAYDPAEPEAWTFAQIADFDESGSLSLSTRLPDSVTRVGVATVGTLSIFTQMVQNVRIEGWYSLRSQAAGAANAESGVKLLRVQNITVLAQIYADNPGAGAVVTQYAEDVYLYSITVRTSVMQGAQESKGRGISIAESNRVRIRYLEVNGFDNAAVVVEAGCQNISIGTLNTNDTALDRASTSLPLVHLLGGSVASIDRLTSTGASPYVYDADEPSMLTITDAYFRAKGSPTIQDLGVVQRRFNFGGVTYSSRRTAELMVALQPGMLGQIVALPRGYYYDFNALLSTAIGLSAMYLGWGDSASRIDLELKVGTFVAVSQGQGFGQGYKASDSVMKQLTIYTSSAVPTGAFLELRLGYYAA